MKLSSIKQKEGEKMTTILALQGSPRGSKGNTDVMLQEFLRGAASAGATTETVYLNKLELNHCTGCYSCWIKTPGVCIFKDDMPEILEKMRQCDVLVIATPVYSRSMTSLTKTAIDRMLPLADPHFVKMGDIYKHPSRYNRQYKTVLISNCGFPNMKEFDALRHIFRLREELGHTVMAGELLMPSGVVLTLEELKEMLKNYYDSFYRAGVEVVKSGRISSETEQSVQKPPFDPEDFFEIANQKWDKALQEAGLL